MDRPDIRDSDYPPDWHRRFLHHILAGAGPVVTAEGPAHSDVDWMDELTRKNVQRHFSAFLMGKSAEELVALAERVEEEATAPDDERRTRGRASAWYIPFSLDDYEAPDWDGDWGSGGGGGDWSA